MDNVFLVVPCNGSEMKLRWDDKLYKGLIPKPDDRCTLLYDGMQIDVDVNANDMHTVLNQRHTEQAEVSKLEQRIRNMNLIGNVFIAHSRLSDIEYCSANWSTLYEISWDLTPTVSKTGRITKVVGTVSFNLLSEVRNRQFSYGTGKRYEWSTPHQYHKTLRLTDQAIPVYVVDGPKERLDEFMVTKLLHHFQMMADRNHRDIGGVWQPNYANWSYISYAPAGCGEDAFPIIRGLHPSELILDGVALQMELTRYQELGMRVNHIVTAEIQANARIKAAKIIAKGQVQAAEIQALATLQAGYAIGGAIAMAGKTHARWERSLGFGR